MMGSLSSAVTGLDNEQTAMDVIGNNLANSNTVGFKGSDVEFESLLSQSLSTGAAPTAAAGGTDPEQIGLGMNLGAITQNMAEGGLQETGNPTDLAIQGNGMFLIEGNGQTLYTRAGNFGLDSSGDLVTTSGDHVMGWSAVGVGGLTTWPPATTTLANVAPLTVPQTLTGNSTQGTVAGVTYAMQSFSIGSDGTMSGVYEATSGAGAGTTITVTLGQVALANVPNPQGLVPAGDTAWAMGPNAQTAANPITASPPGTNGLATLTVGALEQSNVDLASQMTNMVTVEAAYEADTKVVSTAQQMVQALLAMKQ